MDNPHVIFLALKKMLSDKLVLHNYHQSHEEFDSTAFNSSYADFRNKNMVYRLIWDGRDACFYLEVCNNFQSYPSLQWVNLLTYPFGVFARNDDTKASLIKTFAAVISEIGETQHQ